MARWDQIAAGLQFGWSITYALQIEGIPTVFFEDQFDVPVIAGLTYDNSLIIDESATVGSVVDRQEGIGRGFDLSVRLLDTSIVRSYFIRPANKTKLTTDLLSDFTIINVESTAGFASSGQVFIGSEGIKYSGSTATTFTGLTRGLQGKPLDHSADELMGTVVTDGPRWWRGRRATLSALAIDPFGKLGGTTPSLSNGAIIWEGFITTAPFRDGNNWALECRALDRRLDEGLIAAISGPAQWTIKSDPSVKVVKDFALQVIIQISRNQQGQGFLFDSDTFSMVPFADISGTFARVSELRQAIVDKWAVASASVPEAGDLFWVEELRLFGSGVQFVWQAKVKLDLSAFANANWFTTNVNFTVVGGGGGNVFYLEQSDWQASYTQDLSLMVNTTGLISLTTQSTTSLRMRVEDNDPADVPNEGWIILESDAGIDWYQYTDALTVEGDPAALDIIIAPNGNPNTQDLAAADIQGQIKEVTAKIAFRDTGLVKDTMRRMLMSSGRANDKNNATFDTLPLEQGYDLDEVNTPSFDRIFDGITWGTIQVDLLLDENASFVSIYKGLCAISQRAIVTVGSGEVSLLTAVHTGLPDTSVFDITITDDSLISVGDASPVRPRVSLDAPNRITVSLKSTSEGKDGSIIVNDLSSIKSHGATSWDLDIYGIRRNLMVDAAQTWGYAIFANAQTSQVIELDVHPSIRIEVGDAISLDIRHHSLWQWSTGVPGYTGSGRVLGKQIALGSAVVTLTILIDGVNRAVAISPSAKIKSFTGAASAATAIKVDASLFDTFTRYLNDTNPFTLIAYDPSREDASGDGYDISGVALAGGDCELTVAAQNGVFSISTDWFLSLPTTAVGNASQDEYLHTDTAAVWS